MTWLPGARVALLSLFGLGLAGPDASSPAPERTPSAAPLTAETGEVNPRSATVRLKLSVLPVTAEVVWGAKRLGTAGREPLEIERPRNSGPLDLVVRAPGYLSFHTRLLTDRDDTLTVRLVTPAAARSLLGWKRTAPVEKRP
jgi:hypothetical protein